MATGKITYHSDSLYWEDGDTWSPGYNRYTLGTMISADYAQLCYLNPKKIDHLTNKTFTVTQCRTNGRQNGTYFGTSDYTDGGYNFLSYVKPSDAWAGFFAGGAIIGVIINRSNLGRANCNIGLGDANLTFKFS